MLAPQAVVKVLCFDYHANFLLQWLWCRLFLSSSCSAHVNSTFMSGVYVSGNISCSNPVPMLGYYAEPNAKIIWWLSGKRCNSWAWIMVENPCWNCFTLQGFSNMALIWLPAVLSTIQKAGVNILVNTLGLRENGCHFPDNFFECILNENV